MKREGHQHGLVRTYCSLSKTPTITTQRQINPRNEPLAAGIFTRVTSKPTNHSKFSGKCQRTRCTDCHLHPAWRSKDKIKGTHKLRSSNMALDYGGFVAWRVVDNDRARQGSNKLKLTGYSASRILDELTSDCNYSQHESECEYDYDEDAGGNESSYGGCSADDGDEGSHNLAKIEVIEGEMPMALRCEDNLLNGSLGCGEIVLVGADEDDEDSFGFFDVAIVWEPIEGDEGWSLVGEM